jgi:hypothetical protein
MLFRMLFSRKWNVMFLFAKHSKTQTVQIHTYTHPYEDNHAHVILL